MQATDDTNPSASPTMPPPPAPRRRRVGGAILAATLGLIGIALAVVAWGGPAGTVMDGTATIRPSATVDRIDLAVETGTIELVSGDELVLEVTRPERDFVVESDQSDGMLRVRVACPRPALLRGCRTPVRLVIPPDVHVIATTEVGAISAAGLTAGAELRTQAGSIDVHDLAGAVRLTSETGALRGSVLTGSIEATTTTGVIALRVIDDIRHLVATTEVGTIDLTVPDISYQVDVGATLGRTDIDTAHTPGAARSLAARSELGRITIRTDAP
jgi:hypothetical protein